MTEPTTHRETALDTAELSFVDPAATASSNWRIVLWGPPGEGKTVGAATSPGPIIALNADRPKAWEDARKLHPEKQIDEVRYVNTKTFDEVLAYIRANPGKVGTVAIDTFNQIYDRTLDQVPKRADGDPDYQRLNKRLLDVLVEFRTVDVNLVICAHEKLNDGKRGDGKLYPSLGGPSLINKVMAESDIVARVYKDADAQGNVRHMAALNVAENVVTKTKRGLPDVMPLDVSAMIEAVNAA